MTSTTLEPSFLQACLLLRSFKGKAMVGAEAALLAFALSWSDSPQQNCLPQSWAILGTLPGLRAGRSCPLG